MKRFLLVLVATAASLCGQGAPAPPGKQQYFTNSGLPDANGSLCTFVNTTSTPQPTYSNFLLSVANPTCIPLDAAGRPSTGGIYLGSLIYTFQLLDSGGSTIWTYDGIGAANPNIVSPFSFSAGAIFNNVAGKTCLTTTGSFCGALALLNLQGASIGTNLLFRIDDSSGNPGMALFANGVSAGAYAATAAGLQLRDGTGNSQMTVTPNGVTFENGGPGLTTLNVIGSASQGSTNLFQVQTNAGSTVAWIAGDGTFSGPAFKANVTGAGIGFQTDNLNFSVNGNGDLISNGLVNIIGATTLTNPLGYALTVNGPSAPLAIIDALGNAVFATLTCTGTPCGGGGGGSGSPGVPLHSVQFNNPLGTFAGSSNFTYDPTGQLLTVTCNSFNCIQAPTGGVVALNLDATNYTRVGTFSGAPTLTGGETGILGAIYFDTGGSFKGCTAATGTTCNTWSTFAAGSAAAFGSITSGTNTTAAMVVGVGASLTFIGGFSGTGTINANRFNGVVAPVSGSIWKSDASLHPIPATGADIAAAFCPSGDAAHYLAADGTCQPAAGGGGLWSSSGVNLYATANNSRLLVGHTLDDGTGSQLQVLGACLGCNGNISASGTIQTAEIAGAGSAFQISNGLGNPFIVDGNGDISANGKLNMTGAVTGTNPSGHAYEVGGLVIVDSGRNATFNNLTVAGTCTGCGGGGGGGGGVTALNSLTGSLTISGTNITVSPVGSTITLSIPQSIASTSSPTFAGLTSTGGVTVTGALAANGGFSTGSATNSSIFIGTGGNFYNRPVAGASAGISCISIADGWTAITNDDYVVVCLGGSRFRAALVPF